MLTRGKVLFLLLTLGLVGWLVYDNLTSHVTNHNPTGKTIVAFGDSITAGYGVLPSATFVSLLEKELKVSIINAGVSGDTTEMGLARFPSVVMDNEPRVVLLELGGNDVIQQLPLDEVERNLDTMIREIHARGAAVLLIGTDLPTGMGGLKGRIKKLAKKHNCAVIPNVMSGIMGNRQYMLDRVHPNAEGHKLIAERIARKLRNELPAVFPKK